MSGWSNHVELREENGGIRAFRISDNREIPIPTYPKAGADITVWLSGLSLDALEASRQYYLDHWTWENGSPEYRDLVALIASEIGSRLPFPSKEQTYLKLAYYQGQVNGCLTNDQT